MRPGAQHRHLYLGSVTLVAMALCCLGRCIHDNVQQKVSGVTAIGYGGDGGVGRSGRASLPRPLPIRIATHYSTIQNMVLKTEERSRLNSSVQEAIRLLTNLLAVVPVANKLLLSRDMDAYCKSVWRNTSLPNYNKCGQKNDNYRKESCLDILIPDDHLQGYSVWPAQGNTPTVIQQDGQGVQGADFILYIKAADTSKCRREPSVIAYAAYCKVDQTGRPIAGAVTFCHSRLRGSAFDHRRTTLTTVHELLHALGFSKDLYSTWRDCTSAPSIGVNCSRRSSVTNTDDQRMLRIYTRAVIQNMQQHFNSSWPELGGPLENGVQVGFPSSHWESRFLQGSIMTAKMGVPRHTFIDPITLAALSDTGWYQVNSNSTQALVWGRGQGETFGLTSTCHDNSSEYFCTGSGLGCHYLHLEKGSCQTDDLLEGCRIYKLLMNGSECWKEENARNAGNLNVTGEIYGERSRCFFANLSRAQAPSSPDLKQPIAGHCYLHRCVGVNAFEVKVQGSSWLQCPAGDSVQVPGFRGLLSCPDGRLCRHADSRTPDSSPRTEADRSTRAPPPGGLSESARPSARLHVQIAVNGSEECTAMEEQDAWGVAESLVNITAIPRCHIQNMRVCSSLELCLEVWEYSRCSDHSAVSVYRLLQQRISAGELKLKIDGKTCTAISIRSASGPSTTPPPLTEARRAPVMAAAICASLGAALAGGALGAGIYRKLRGRRGRVRAGRSPPAPSPSLTDSGRERGIPEAGLSLPDVPPPPSHCVTDAKRVTLDLRDPGLLHPPHHLSLEKGRTSGKQTRNMLMV